MGPVIQHGLLDHIFGDPSAKQGLKFFIKGERDKIKLRAREGGDVDIWCAKRERWFRAKPEEVVRQLFLVWIQDTLKYSLTRAQVEWPVQMGEDAEKERNTERCELTNEHAGHGR